MRGWCHSCGEGNMHDLLGSLSDPRSRRQKTLISKPCLHKTFEDADLAVVECWKMSFVGTFILGPHSISSSSCTDRVEATS